MLEAAAVALKTPGILRALVAMVVVEQDQMDTMPHQLLELQIRVAVAVRAVLIRAGHMELV